MKRALAGLMLLAHPALAQAPTEHVTVTGIKSPAVIQGFVKSFTPPTRVVDKIARWEEGICPYAVGIQPAAADFVVARVIAVAAAAGAPVSRDPKCRFNVAIVFTRTPQALMDDVMHRQSWLLGWWDTRSQREALARFDRPVKSWYATQSTDFHGISELDMSTTARFVMGELGARKVNVTGSRLDTGVRSGFYSVLIVADPGQLADLELGTVSDHIALLALAQAPGGCPMLDSIAGLFTPGCGRPTALTAADLAYLRGLYAMQAGLRLADQRNQIAGTMRDALGR
jgi:hypothetical protein